MRSTATYTPRERALFGEILETEMVLAEALGYPLKKQGDPGYLSHRATYDVNGQSILDLANEAASRLAERGEASGPDVTIRHIASSWAGNIEEWLKAGSEEDRSTDYGDGFADGWAHALTMLKSLTAAAEAATP